LADICGYGYSRSHSRWFWGCRLHLACVPDGTPRGVQLAPADRPEREVALALLPRALRGGETIVCDKGYAGKDFEAGVGKLGATIIRPPRVDEEQKGPHLAPIRQRIESVFWTCKDLLNLERHGARTPRNLVVRIVIRLLALVACICLNYELGRPSRAIVDYTA
jgi:hypothetical protein